jgi:ubiquinone/menaquinone biosynthesis C-methylase UbiE
MQTIHKSYERHAQSYKNVDKTRVLQWTNEDTVDYWRHNRMFETLLPLLNNYPNAKWLTVGDGKYGTDAHYILKHTPNVLATDIAEDCLKEAKAAGFIPDYRIENAEKLSFENDAFDFAVCKEAYHHFPRPFIAVYEMLRVAKKAVVLIEPNDPSCVIPEKFSFGNALFWFIQAIKNVIKKIIGKEIYYKQGGYEPDGNFVYYISEREIEKLALGLNYEMLAFKGMNDVYIEGVENELLKDKGPKFRAIKNMIEKEDKKVQRGRRVPNMLTAILFKEEPNEACMRDLRSAGFKITKLMKNPYCD